MSISTGIQVGRVPASYFVNANFSCNNIGRQQVGWKDYFFELADKFLQKSRIPFTVNFSMLCLVIVLYDPLSD